MQTILTITLIATAIMLIVTTNRLRSTRRSISDVLKDTAKTQEINSQLIIDNKVWEERYKNLEASHETFVSEFEQYKKKKEGEVVLLHHNLCESQHQIEKRTQEAEFYILNYEKEKIAHLHTVDVLSQCRVSSKMPDFI